ncbi:MAG: hypothetical protein ISEC1_P0759 [Thiomicrorhabdus sp.]|nr:MAG: hypothetical protein ISEC1_P0759 [Thiomicrorhabdus sp.]
MAANQITPQEMFSAIGSTMSQITTENKSSARNGIAISKIEIEINVEISSNLQLSALPNNQILKLDAHSEKAFFKIKVAAY